MSAIDDLANRIETTLKVTDGPGMDVRFALDRDAVTALMEQLRITARLLVEHEQLRRDYERLLQAADAVCELDWSDNDDDAVATIDVLRNELPRS